MLADLRDKIKKHKPVFCIGISIIEPSLIEMAAISGYDAAIVDACQMRYSPERIREMILAGDTKGIPVIVRAASCSDATAYLNFGAVGIMFDGVKTRWEAEKLVSVCKYAPIGKRGICSNSRCHNYGLGDLKEQINWENENIILILQIEDREGLENREEILKVPGIDLISGGRNDMAQSLGVPGQTNHPAVIEAEKLLCESVERAGLPPVLLVPSSLEQAKQFVKAGHNIFSVGQDSSMIFSAMKRSLKTLQLAVKDQEECNG